MKIISTLSMLALCIGLQSADAGLLGMPLNLKAAVGQIDLDTPTALGNQSREFLTDEVLIGPALVISC
jgi:hypothetical protein